MSASKHLGIRDAVAALFTAATALAGGRVLENRDAPLDATTASQIHVYRVQSAPTRELVGATAPIDWVTDIRVVIKARKSVSASAEAVADDIACDCYARLMADQTLGGLCSLMDPGPFVWDQDEMEATVAVAAMEVRIQHRTNAHAIT